MKLVKNYDLSISSQLSKANVIIDDLCRKFIGVVTYVITFIDPLIQEFETLKLEVIYLFDVKT